MTTQTTCTSSEMGEALRSTARQFITGVTIVAVSGDPEPYALTANSFVTLSLRPPLVAVAIRPGGRFRHLLRGARYFGISILSASQQAYARFYADPRRSDQVNETLLVQAMEPFSVPVVPKCLGYLACVVIGIRSVGDHDLVIGEVRECRVNDVPQQPLTFFGGALRGYTGL